MTDNDVSPTPCLSRRQALQASAMLVLPVIDACAAVAAGMQAIDVSGEYLGTYTPRGGAPSQLQMSLDPLQPGQGNQFTGYGSMRVNGDLLEFDITGSARRRRGQITAQIRYEGNETADTVNFSGQLNRRRNRLSGDFNGTLNGNAVRGRFKVDKR